MPSRNRTSESRQAGYIADLVNYRLFGTSLQNARGNRQVVDKLDRLEHETNRNPAATDDPNPVLGKEVSA